MLYAKAYRDIEDIYEYIAITKAAPQNAKGQTDRILDAIKTLEEYPQSHQDRLEGRYAGKEYKQLVKYFNLLGIANLFEIQSLWSC